MSTVSLRVAGQSYRVVSSESEVELQRLADHVTAKVEELTPPGRAPAPQAVVLAALSLAHELEVERSRRLSAERKSRDVLRRMLGRIDDALATTAED